MKPSIKSIITLALAGVVMSGAVSAITEKDAYAANGVNKIVVNGEGSVTVTPDIAHISLGITTIEKDPKTAQQNNDAQMSRLIETLKDIGIEEKDIQTSNYSIYPERDYNNGNKITGYAVNNNVSVTIRNLDDVGTVLDKCITAGANTGTGIQFGIEDSSKLYEQALALAIGNANDKSKAIANALGTTVSGPIEVRETSGVSVARVSGKLMMDAGVPVESGSLVVTASVEVTYSY